MQIVKNMDPSMFDVCLRAVLQSLLKAVTADPFRSLLNPKVKRQFLKDVTDQLRRHGYNGQVETRLVGSNPAITIVLSRGGVDATYTAHLDMETLISRLRLNQCVPDLPSAY